MTKPAKPREVIGGISSRTRSPLVDIPAVAERLGVSERFVRRLVFERRIPYVKVGRLVRFDPAAVEQWIDDATEDVATIELSSRALAARLRPATTRERRRGLR